MGAETAAPVARTPGRRRGAAPASGAAEARAPMAAGPIDGNRARLSLLNRVGPVMRSCGCGCGGEDTPILRSAIPGAIMRCGCGCGGACEDRSVARKAEGGSGAGMASAVNGVASVVGRPGMPLESRTRSRMESSFGRDFGDVRVHTDPAAHHSARRLGAKAYTVGDHIVFGAGQYAPDRRDGQQLLAHELTHTVQQRDRRHVQRAGTVSRPGDPHEREAESVAAAVMAGATVSPSLTVQPGTIQRGLLNDIEQGLSEVVDAGEAVYDAGAELVGEGVELVEDVVDEGVEFVEDVVDGIQEIYDLAHDIAAAISGAISVSGCGISVTIPPISVDHSLVLNLPVPEIPLMQLPIAAGVWPIAGIVNAYGMIYLHLTLVPTLAVQIGPGAFNGGSLTIDWCAPSLSGAAGITYTIGASLGAELRAGIGGEVGANINVPVPGGVIPLFIPAMNIEGGLVGALLGSAAQTVTEAVTFGYAGGTLSFTDDAHHDIGLMLSAGAGAYGALSAFGINLCTLYWPFWTKAWESTYTLDRWLHASIGTSGASLDYGLVLASPGTFDFADLPVALNTDVMTDDCPVLEALCRILYAMGAMPSQNGGTWSAWNPPRWPGPLDVYQRSVSYTKSLCRGACGPDCRTCAHAHEERACVEDGGRHHWVVYPMFERCSTHHGCREHDGCYDWAAFGTSPVVDFGLHRMCDLECLCNHPAASCIGWIFGIGGDGEMHFSEQPYEEPGCDGPCPQETVDPATGVAMFQTCLPPVALTDPMMLEKTYSDSTGNIPIYSKFVPIPKLGGVMVNVFASGTLDATGRAGLGAIMLQNVCLDVDPTGPVYRGTGELIVPLVVDAIVSVTGAIGATLDWLCLLQLARADGGLTATGTASNVLTLISRVDVVCNGGELDLVASAALHNALRLGFDLDAFLRVTLLGWQVYSDTWNLVSASYVRDWDWELGVLNRSAGSGAITPQLAVGPLPAMEALNFLLADQPDAAQEEPPSGILGTLLSLCGPPGPETEDPRCGQPSLPFTVIDYQADSDRGRRVIAKPLTKCSKTKGSEPQESAYKATWDECIRPSGQSTKWVKAHLLHGKTASSPVENLHGPGVVKNLINTDKSINGQMNSKVEKEAIRAAWKESKVLWYDVEVKEYFGNSGHERYFGKRIHMAWGEYDPVANKVINTRFNDDIESNTKLPMPPCPGAAGAPPSP